MSCSNLKALRSDCPRTISSSPASLRLWPRVSSHPPVPSMSRVLYVSCEPSWLHRLTSLQVWWWRTRTGRASWSRPSASSTSWPSPPTSCARACCSAAPASSSIRPPRPPPTSTRTTARARTAPRSPASKVNEVSPRHGARISTDAAWSSASRVSASCPAVNCVCLAQLLALCGCVAFWQVSHLERSVSAELRRRRGENEEREEKEKGPSSKAKVTRLTVTLSIL